MVSAGFSWDDRLHIVVINRFKGCVFSYHSTLSRAITEFLFIRRLWMKVYWEGWCGAAGWDSDMRSRTNHPAANIPCLLTYPARSLGVLDNVRRMWAACKNIYLTDHSLAGAAQVVHLLFSLHWRWTDNFWNHYDWPQSFQNRNLNVLSNIFIFSSPVTVGRMQEASCEEGVQWMAAPIWLIVLSKHAISLRLCSVQYGNLLTSLELLVKPERSQQGQRELTGWKWPCQICQTIFPSAQLNWQDKTHTALDTNSIAGTWNQYLPFSLTDNCLLFPRQTTQPLPDPEWKSKLILISKTTFEKLLRCIKSIYISKPYSTLTVIKFLSINLIINLMTTV